MAPHIAVVDPNYFSFRAPVRIIFDYTARRQRKKNFSGAGGSFNRPLHIDDDEVAAAATVAELLQFFFSFTRTHLSAAPATATKRPNYLLIFQPQ